MSPEQWQKYSWARRRLIELLLASRVIKIALTPYERYCISKHSHGLTLLPECVVDRLGELVDMVGDDGV